MREQAGPEGGGVALFDLDGTLLPWDMQLLFCNYVLRRRPLRRLYLFFFLPALPFAPLLGPARLKRVFLSFLWGMRRERLTELVEGFVAQHVPDAFYGEVLEEAARERARGRRTVLISASPEFYVAPVGEALRFDFAFGTRVEFGDSVPLFPKFRGGNNKHAAKVSRLREELGIRTGGIIPDSAGYSDSMADQPMLQLCEEKTVIHPEGELQALAERRGWRSLRPPRPYRDRRAFLWRCAKQVCGMDKQ